MQLFDILKKTVLFNGVGKENLSLALACLGAITRSYPKNSSIIDIGDEVKEVGILISGSANAVTETINGDLSIIDKLHPGDTFGEAIVCAGSKVSPIRLIAVTDCDIIKIQMKNIINPNLTTCRFRGLIVENLLKMTASGYLSLNRKINILSHKSIRERVMLYLSDEMSRCASCEFYIPFNRNELAEYLQVERSALSRELSRIRGEGYIYYDRSYFKILDTDHFERMR